MNICLAPACFNMNRLLADEFMVEIGRWPRGETPLASHIEDLQRKFEMWVLNRYHCEKNPGIGARARKGDVHMPKEGLEWQLRRTYCPNCRCLSVGFEDKDGRTKMTCGSCGAIMVRKKMGRRHDRIDIYAPCGQELIYN